MSEQTDANTIEDVPVGPERILERDGWTCQVCGYTPPKGSDEPMFATRIGEDKTNPDHFNTRCSDCHENYYGDETPTTQEQKQESVRRTTYDPDSIGTRLYRTSFAMVVFLPTLAFGGGLTIAGITALNPLRMVGMSGWPHNNWDEGAITFQQYVNDIIFEVPPTIIGGVVILVVGTQISILIEPKDGFITRLTKWTLGKVRN